MSTDAPAPDFGPDSGPDSAGLMRRIDTTKAHPARAYDVFLGGTDNFPADREAAAMALALALAANPRGHLNVRHNRDFVRRAVTELTTRAGIRQFLDVGAGLPTRQNVHQIVQDIAPESRIVYVDHDPVVLVHAQALLTSSTEGGTDYVEADLRDQRRSSWKRAGRSTSTGRSPSFSPPYCTSSRTTRHTTSSGTCWTLCPPAAISS